MDLADLRGNSDEKIASGSTITASSLPLSLPLSGNIEPTTSLGMNSTAQTSLIPFMRWMSAYRPMTTLFSRGLEY
jgi:hypothetical protein